MKKRKRRREERGNEGKKERGKARIKIEEKIGKKIEKETEGGREGGQLKIKERAWGSVGREKRVGRIKGVEWHFRIPLYIILKYFTCS